MSNKACITGAAKFGNKESRCIVALPLFIVTQTNNRNIFKLMVQLLYNTLWF